MFTHFLRRKVRSRGVSEEEEVVVWSKKRISLEGRRGELYGTGRRTSLRELMSKRSYTSTKGIQKRSNDGPKNVEETVGAHTNVWEKISALQQGCSQKIWPTSHILLRNGRFLSNFYLCRHSRRSTWDSCQRCRNRRGDQTEEQLQLGAEKGNDQCSYNPEKDRNAVGLCTSLFRELPRLSDQTSSEAPMVWSVSHILTVFCSPMGTRTWPVAADRHCTGRLLRKVT